MAQGKSLFSPRDWLEIQHAYEAGLTDAELCRDFSILPSTIRKRRSKDRQQGKPWLSPAEIKRKVEEEHMRNKMRPMGNGTRELPMSGDEAIAKKMITDGGLATEHAMKILLSKLTLAAMNPAAIADLEDVNDVATAVRSARSIAGLDKPETTIQINLGSMFPSD